MTDTEELPLAEPASAAAPDGDVVRVRLSADETAAIDAWAARQRPRKTDRAAAVRELLGVGLALYRDLT
jgi:hypothetical protein